MAQETIVLITGSKAGIGKGLLSTYAQRSNTLAIAAIRDGLDSGAAEELISLPTGKQSKVIVVKYDAASPTAAVELEQELREKHGVQHLDIVVANAGILSHSGPAKDVSVEELQQHLLVNTIAPILLYKSTTALLNSSKKEPKFFVVSSSLGSNGLMDDYAGLPLLAYGMSKAAVNYATSRIHREEDRIAVVPVQPGWVQTAMGVKAAHYVGLGLKDVPVTIEASVAGLVKLFDSVTKAAFSGKFWDYNGEQIPW